jgi:16S rRNA (cytosine967-C5)-methyltransferase
MKKRTRYGRLGFLITVLLLQAACLRPGGRLVYATCTFRREENEEVALAFERRRPDLDRVPALPPGLAVARNGGAPGPLGADGFLRTWPHRHGTDGFFAAAWIRRRAGGP